MNDMQRRQCSRNVREFELSWLLHAVAPSQGGSRAGHPVLPGGGCWAHSDCSRLQDCAGPGALEEVHPGRAHWPSQALVTPGPVPMSHCQLLMPCSPSVSLHGRALVKGQRGACAAGPASFQLSCGPVAVLDEVHPGRGHRPSQALVTPRPVAMSHRQWLVACSPSISLLCTAPVDAQRGARAPLPDSTELSCWPIAVALRSLIKAWVTV